MDSNSGTTCPLTSPWSAQLPTGDVSKLSSLDDKRYQIILFSLNTWEYLHTISNISFDLMISDQVQAAVPKDTLLIRDKNRLKQVNKFLITVDAAFK